MNRKLSIARTAEELFAERGYDNTSTQLIAKEAGVSEALIFKHFGSKDKLLEYLIKNGYRRIVEHNRGMLMDGDPLEFVHSLLDLPGKLVANEPKFWELQYRLTDTPMAVMEHERFLQPVHTRLIKAFKSLGYEDPANETTLLMLLVDALWKREILRGSGSSHGIAALMKKKYIPVK